MVAICNYCVFYQKRPITWDIPLFVLSMGRYLSPLSLSFIQKPASPGGLSPRVRPHSTMLLGAMGIHSSRIGVNGSLDRMAVQHLMSTWGWQWPHHPCLEYAWGMALGGFPIMKTGQRECKTLLLFLEGGGSKPITITFTSYFRVPFNNLGTRVLTHNQMAMEKQPRSPLLHAEGLRILRIR